jgi:hypothetical protein
VEGKGVIPITHRHRIRARALSAGRDVMPGGCHSMKDQWGIPIVVGSELFPIMP